MKARKTGPTPQALEGIRILDWTTYFAGPAATALLADMGAEVIMIEPPGTGEASRTVKTIGGVPMDLPGGRNIAFEGAARSKKSLAVNLQTAKGREIVYRLAQKSDVFVTNYRAKTIKACGMDSASLKKANPNIIHAQVSGYGPKGPYSQQGGFDFIIQGHSSMAFCMGEPGTPPTVLHFAPLDSTCATLAAHSVIMALYVRDRLGIVQDVHTSILGTAIWMLYIPTLIALYSGKDTPRHSRSRSSNPLRNLYECKDGKWLIGSHVPPDRWWPRFCKALGIEELENDPRFKDETARARHAEEFISVLDKVFATKPREEWLWLAEKHDLIISPVHSTAEMINDPQVLASEYVTTVEHQELGKVRMPGYCTHFSKTPVKIKRGAPKLGEHTEEVLGTLGGYSQKEISLLREEGVL